MVLLDEVTNISEVVVHLSTDLGVGNQPICAPFLGSSDADAEDAHKIAVVDHLLWVEDGWLLCLPLFEFGEQLCSESGEFLLKDAAELVFGHRENFVVKGLTFATRFLRWR